MQIDDNEWEIGLVVGRSGSGKTTIAKEFWADSIYLPQKRTQSKSIIDEFPKSLKTAKIVELLSSVGLSSPPSWLKPYHVLSMGERFRVDLATALATTSELVVFDEFTSVVDRTVAKIGSLAVSKAIRRSGKRFIAVSCHSDIKRWLEPDWVFDVDTNQLARSRLQRPKIKLDFGAVNRNAWSVFAKHHYLSATMNHTSRCYGCFYKGIMIGFAAILPAIGTKNYSRVHRIVVLPDYQGVGIGGAFLDFLGSYYKSIGRKMSITSSHPSIIKGLRRRKDWRCVMFQANGSVKQGGIHKDDCKGRQNVFLASFRYMGV
ncbi:ABC transporter ATP-binding protein [Candidatus Falkowbacteria bacterium]|nr:MAG: ABC transporter ATP-binding protein [Candidatus Falkowbacteria bacterium]